LTDFLTTVSVDEIKKLLKNWQENLTDFFW